MIFKCQFSSRMRCWSLFISFALQSKEWKSPNFSSLGQESNIRSMPSLPRSGALKMMRVSRFCMWPIHSIKDSLRKPGNSNTLTDLSAGAFLMIKLKHRVGKLGQVISKCLRWGKSITLSFRTFFMDVKGHSFWMISDSMLGLLRATSIMSKPAHCIFKPFNCLPVR